MKQVKRTLEYAAFPDPAAGVRAPPTFDRLVGESPRVATVFEALRRAAPRDTTILIEGETGTGKEVAAEAIHQESPRRDRPFVVVDCGALPPQLLESELFGHLKGAFTGAVADRPGAFEVAAGGTVFLDEIGELDFALQPKLLRALERREVKRVGSNQYQPLDVRIVAATNRDLRHDVERGRFRSDLYYRLAVVAVRLPPLRERPEDLVPLVQRMLGELGAREEEAGPLLAPEFLAQLARHTWPGNVRELRNHVERCLAIGQPLPPDALDAGGPSPAPEPELQLDAPLREARDAWVRAFERRYLEAQLRRHGFNVSAAARAAGIDRGHFYRLLWKHGFTRDDGREFTVTPPLGMPAVPDDEPGAD